jgi:hypothetical protein
VRRRVSHVAIRALRKRTGSKQGQAHKQAEGQSNSEFPYFRHRGSLSFISELIAQLSRKVRHYIFASVGKVDE